MSAESKAPIDTTEDEPFVWDGLGTVHYDEKTNSYWIELTPEESRVLWEQEVHEHLGMSPDEFLRKLDAGEYGEAIDWPENRKALRLAMSRPDQR